MTRVVFGWMCCFRAIDDFQSVFQVWTSSSYLFAWRGQQGSSIFEQQTRHFGFRRQAIISEGGLMVTLFSHGALSLVCSNCGAAYLVKYCSECCRWFVVNLLLNQLRFLGVGWAIVYARDFARWVKSWSAVSKWKGHPHFLALQFEQI